MSDRYREFLCRVEAFFLEIRARHPDAIQCRLGCHSCCKPGLTVGPLEAARIREGVSDPARRQALIALEREDPYQGSRCAFLDRDGACGIYELRPLVCRSHGVPLEYKGEGEERYRDVCPLNFEEENLAELPSADVMNLDTLNTLLALLTKVECGASEERTELKPSALWR